MSVLDRAELERLLPHRDPFLLIDRAEDFVAGESLVGVREVRADEYYFPGHFPGRPVVPGVLLIEAMAQTGAALAGKSDAIDPAEAQLMLAAVESARFRAPVTPGQTLYLHVRLTGARRGVYRFEGEAKVDGARVAEAAFTAMLSKGPR